MSIFPKFVYIINLLRSGLSTTHFWCDDYSTNISICEVYGTKAGVQVCRRELHIHIHLDYVKVEFYIVSKK